MANGDHPEWSGYRREKDAGIILRALAGEKVDDVPLCLRFAEALKHDVDWRGNQGLLLKEVLARRPGRVAIEDIFKAARGFYEGKGLDRDWLKVVGDNVV